MRQGKPKQPQRKKRRRKRYTLEQLLAESKAANLFRKTKEIREWLKAPRVGREII